MIFTAYHCNCRKKKKFMRIHSNEGLGINDGKEYESEIVTHVCRFKFDKFPIDKTTFVLAITKDEDPNAVKQMKKDLRHIQTYMARRRYCRESNSEDHILWLKFKDMTFEDFLEDLGMMKNLSAKLSKIEKFELARKRYLKALRADIKGIGAVYHRRNPSDVFINNYSRKYMTLLKSNHDLQYITEPHACANYVTAYVTKNEAGHSKLVENIDKYMQGKTNDEVVAYIGDQIDRKREISIQEGIYRKNGLPMSKFSTKIKFLSSNHPDYRSGLLKENYKDLEENESLFYMSSQEYYEKRPEGYSYGVDWDAMTLAEFESEHERSSNPSHSQRPNAIALLDNCGFLFRRTKRAVLRYFLNYEDPVELARGLLVLFFPFRDEESEIHNKNVMELLYENQDSIEDKRKIFERNMSLIDLINDIAKNREENNDDNDDEEEDEEIEVDDFIGETTEEKDIDDFLKAAKQAAMAKIRRTLDMSVPDEDTILERIIMLNHSQRLIFDDIVERFSSNIDEEKTFCLYIAGEAGDFNLYSIHLLKH